MAKYRRGARFINLLLVNILVCLIIKCSLFASYTLASQFSPHDTIEDNEFAEFEEIDEDSDEFIPRSQQTPQPVPTPPPASAEAQSESSRRTDDTDGIVEDEYEDEFETVHEEEVSEKPNLNTETKKEDLKITKIPMHLRANWESYYLEFFMAFGLIVYFINFILGRNKNFHLANTWFEKNKELLDNNFSLVGDDGKKVIENPGLLKETENSYALWCSGRSSVEGMLTEISLLKRQDLFSIIVNYFKPSNDKILIKVNLNADTMDNFVFCIANRKSAIRLSKEVTDISTFCPERKSPEKYGITSDNYVLLTEIGEAASFILDGKVISLLNKNDDLIDYIHISDQYCGLRNSDEAQSNSKLPEVKKIFYASFNFPAKMNSDLDELKRMKPLLLMMFYLIDKLKRFRLSRESKSKSDRNRQKVEKLFLQSTHLQRQELAQLKREERRRQEKERILQESDPDKQRRWEEKEYKREMKRKVPKMKQLKVKAM